MAHRTLRSPNVPVTLPFGERIPHGSGSAGLREVDRLAAIREQQRMGRMAVGPIFSPDAAGLRAAAASVFFPELESVLRQPEVREQPMTPFGFPGINIDIDLSGIPAGADLRDFTDGAAPQVFQAGGPVVVGLSQVLARLGAASGPIARFFMGAVGGTVRTWNSLPGWVQTILLSIGISRGVSLLMDAFAGDGAAPSFPGPGAADGRPSGIIGSWVANGVTFYRLMDGRLAVQNKRGRWKIWRPKRPIVLMPGGANNLRTLLRADSVLNTQSKKIATMLNRRGQRRVSGSRKPTQVLVAGDDVIIGGSRRTK